ncbi:hypothetical protein [Planktotalea sp.]|uniref:hypothetical protein n=1 Tax=Planktotalea sp. TaxID=2029877 RepID=UPI00329A6516
MFLISGVSSQCLRPEIKNIAVSVAGDAVHFAYLATEGKVASSGSRAFDRAFCMAFKAASAAEAAIDPVNQACDAVSDIRYGPFANDADTIWKQIQLDGVMLEAGEDVMTLALWHDTAPRWFDEAMTSVRQNIQADRSAWDFWMSWWESSIKGELLPEALLTEIAVVPDDVWYEEARIFADVLTRVVTRFENGGEPLRFANTEMANQSVPNSWFWQIQNKIFEKLRNRFNS